MNTTIEQILGEFIDAWNAGQRPDVDAYLERAPDAERDELAAQLATWLEIAPTPSYDEATRAAIGQEPALRAALGTAAAARSPLAARLPTLRERAGLAVRDVARRLVAIFNLDDEQRAAAYLEQIERDELDSSRLSQRLLDALAAILGADRDQLAPGPAAVAAGQAFYRAEQDAEQWIAEDIDALSRAALAPAPPSSRMDELDRLFLGGPDA
jgi:transcriptional regulator with XRE-family HTH domain